MDSTMTNKLIHSEYKKPPEGAVSGIIFSINGPIVKTEGNSGFLMHEMVYVGNEKLIGEVIGLTSQASIIEVYEETGGIKPGELVTGSGSPVSVTLARVY